MTTKKNKTETTRKAAFRVAEKATSSVCIRMTASDLDTIRTLAKDYGYRSLTSYVIDACKKWGGPR